MSRARDVGRLAFGLTVLILWLAWWLPSIALRLARVGGLRTFHTAEMATVDLLFLLRRDRTARRLLAASIRRNRRAIQAVRRRAGRMPR